MAEIHDSRPFHSNLSTKNELPRLEKHLVDPCLVSSSLDRIQKHKGECLLLFVKILCVGIIMKC